MKSTFEWTLANGSAAKLVAEYVCTMQHKEINLDGDKFTMPAKPCTEKDEIVLYVDGKQVERYYHSESWKLEKDEKKGMRRMYGLPIYFGSETAAKYEAWLAELIDAGTTEEVKEYNRQQAERENAEKIAQAKKTIEKAEAQKDIPSRAEAARRMKEYNDIYNEGCGGYVPHIISREEYDAAKKIVANG